MVQWYIGECSFGESSIYFGIALTRLMARHIVYRLTLEKFLLVNWNWMVNGTRDVDGWRNIDWNWIIFLVFQKFLQEKFVSDQIVSANITVGHLGNFGFHGASERDGHKSH